MLCGGCVFSVVFKVIMLICGCLNMFYCGFWVWVFISVCIWLRGRLWLCVMCVICMVVVVGDSFGFMFVLDWVIRLFGIWVMVMFLCRVIVWVVLCMCFFRVGLLCVRLLFVVVIGL